MLDGGRELQNQTTCTQVMFAPAIASPSRSPGAMRRTIPKHLRLNRRPLLNQTGFSSLRHGHYEIDHYQIDFIVNAWISTFPAWPPTAYGSTFVPAFGGYTRFVSVTSPSPTKTSTED